MRSRQPLSLSLYIWRPFSAGLLERFVIALFQFFFVSLPLSLSLNLNSSPFLAHSDIHYSSLYLPLSQSSSRRCRLLQ